jgi:hypothetical protein
MSAAGFAVWQQQLHITLIFIEETRKQLFRYKIAISPHGEKSAGFGEIG